MSAVYVVEPFEYENNYYWGVYENPSEQMVYASMFEDDAIEYRKFLNKGGAFSGFTPSFILQSVDTVEEDEDDINELFESEFKT